jgi:cytoplasmic iron level regulating protein YaaA (DUF328/UPF0246 family)
MKILLAPAETKLKGGDNAPLNNSLSFTPLLPFQNEVINKYVDFIQNATIEELSIWFGLKKLSECERFKTNIKELKTLKAILRYTGVAFEAIEYTKLSETQQKFIEDNVLIFSNLFGVLKANDLIPDYKFKQGALLPSLNTEKFYKEHLKDTLDAYLCGEVLDLRASYYDKFYKPTSNVITYKFLKGGKVVSHWAKHYRGELLRQIAVNNINSFAELLIFKFKDLELVEIQEKKNVRTIIMEIVV